MPNAPTPNHECTLRQSLNTQVRNLHARIDEIHRLLPILIATALNQHIKIHHDSQFLPEDHHHAPL
jgi:hypothetical protein